MRMRDLFAVLEVDSGLGGKLAVAVASLASRRDLVAQVLQVRIKSGVAIGRVGRIQAGTAALVVVVLVNGPRASTRDDGGAIKEACNEHFLLPF